MHITGKGTTNDESEEWDVTGDELLDVPAVRVLTSVYGKPEGNLRCIVVRNWQCICTSFQFQREEGQISRIFAEQWV
jgi:hypothetical protein